MLACTFRPCTTLLSAVLVIQNMLDIPQLVLECEGFATLCTSQALSWGMPCNSNDIATYFALALGWRFATRRRATTSFVLGHLALPRSLQPDACAN